LLQLVDFIGTILSFIGAICIVKKQWYGYVIWCFSNVCWVYLAISIEAWGQAFTFGILYIVVNVWGIYEWRFKKPKNPTKFIIDNNNKFDRIKIFENNKEVVWSDQNAEI